MQAYSLIITVQLYVQLYFLHVKFLQLVSTVKLFQQRNFPDLQYTISKHMRMVSCHLNCSKYMYLNIQLHPIMNAVQAVLV